MYPKGEIIFILFNPVTYTVVCYALNSYKFKKGYGQRSLSSVKTETSSKEMYIYLFGKQLSR